MSMPPLDPASTAASQGAHSLDSFLTPGNPPPLPPRIEAGSSPHPTSTSSDPFLPQGSLYQSFDPPFAPGYSLVGASSDSTPIYPGIELDTRRFPVLSVLFDNNIFLPTNASALNARIEKMSVENRTVLSQLLNAFIAYDTASLATTSSSSSSATASENFLPSEAALALLLSMEDPTDTALLKTFSIGIMRISGHQVTVASLIERIERVRQIAAPNTAQLAPSEEDVREIEPSFAEGQIQYMILDDRTRFAQKLGRAGEPHGLIPLLADLNQLKKLLTVTKQGVGSTRNLAELYRQVTTLKERIIANNAFPDSVKVDLLNFVFEQLEFIKYREAGREATWFSAQMRSMLRVLSEESKLSPGEIRKYEAKLPALDKMGSQQIKLVSSEWDGLVNAYLEIKMKTYLSPADREHQFCTEQSGFLKTAEDVYKKFQFTQAALGNKNQTKSALDSLDATIKNEKKEIDNFEYAFVALNSAGVLLSDNSSRIRELSTVHELNSEISAIRFALSLDSKLVGGALGDATAFLANIVSSNPKSGVAIPNMFTHTVQKYDLTYDLHRVECFKECYAILVDGFKNEIIGEYQAFAESKKASYQRLLLQREELQAALDPRAKPRARQTSVISPGMPSSQPVPFYPSSNPELTTQRGGLYLPSAPVMSSAPFVPVTPPDTSVIQKEQAARGAVVSVIRSLEGFLITQQNEHGFKELCERYYQMVGQYKDSKIAGKVFLEYYKILTGTLNWSSDGTFTWAEDCFMAPAFAIPGVADLPRMVYLRIAAMKRALGEEAHV